MSEKWLEAIIGILIDQANAEEANAVNLKHQLAKLVGVKESVAVNEETFALNYQKQTGNRIGNFEVADKAKNDAEKFQRALNILEKNQATIANRYCGDGYLYGYWKYQGRIYRQKMKTP